MEIPSETESGIINLYNEKKYDDCLLEIRKSKEKNINGTMKIILGLIYQGHLFPGSLRCIKNDNIRNEKYERMYDSDHHKFQAELLELYEMNNYDLNWIVTQVSSGLIDQIITYGNKYSLKYFLDNKILDPNHLFHHIPMIYYFKIVKFDDCIDLILEYGGKDIYETYKKKILKYQRIIENDEFKTKYPIHTYKEYVSEMIYLGYNYYIDNDVKNIIKHRKRHAFNMLIEDNYDFSQPINDVWYPIALAIHFYRGYDSDTHIYMIREMIKLGVDCTVRFPLFNDTLVILALKRNFPGKVICELAEKSDVMTKNIFGLTAGSVIATLNNSSDNKIYRKCISRYKSVFRIKLSSLKHIDPIIKELMGLHTCERKNDNNCMLPKLSRLPDDVIRHNIIPRMIRCEIDDLLGPKNKT